MTPYIIEKLEEQDFRNVVLHLHKEKHFKGDPHRMQASFKLHRGSIGFVSVIYKNNDGDIIAFCGADIFKTSKGDVKGMIHCQGVIQDERGKGLSVNLLNDIEKDLPSNLVEMLSICNPISAKSHVRVGYEVTNPGRITSTGKVSQIRLKKTMNTDQI